MTYVIAVAHECSEKVDGVGETGELSLLYDRSFPKSQVVNFSMEHTFQLAPMKKVHLRYKIMYAYMKANN